MSLVVHTSEYRVYYEDTDAGGVVYHANYLNFMERARTDWLAHCGYLPWKVEERFGVILAVKSAAISFDKPAYLGDQVSVTVENPDVRGASIKLGQRVLRGTETLVFGNFRIACVDAQQFTVRRLPKQLVDRLNNWKA